MSRLLFAAARGARIDKLWFRHKDVQYYDWERSFVVDIGPGHECDYRIRPEDAHLEYGPVSTALREAATVKWDMRPNCFPQLAIRAAMACKLDSNWIHTWQKQTPFERSIALLILAEALADEGL